MLQTCASVEHAFQVEKKKSRTSSLRINNRKCCNYIIIFKKKTYLKIFNPLLQGQGSLLFRCLRLNYCIYFHKYLTHVFQCVFFKAWHVRSQDSFYCWKYATRCHVNRTCWCFFFFCQLFKFSIHSCTCYNIILFSAFLEYTNIRKT